MLHTSMRSLLAAGLLALSAAAQVLTQAAPVRVLPAPPALMQQFDVMVATVQDLQVPPGNPATVVVDFVLAGTPARLELALHDVRAPGFQLLERGANGLQLLPTPACVTYRGHVAGNAGSEVAATVEAGSLRAWIRLGSGDLWIVQPVREVQPAAGASAHIVFRSSDSANVNARCGVPGVVQGAVPPVVFEDVVYVCQIAIEADRPFYLANGSNVTATQNDVTGVVNAMDVIYRRDAQITFSVTQILVDTVSDPYTTNVANTLLTQFRSQWNSVHGGIARDVAHLFTGRPMGQSSGGTIGIAYLGTVCNLGNAYAVSQSRFTTNFAYRVAVTAHEIGHNFGANHCDSAPPCNIMCSGVGGCGNNPSSFSTNEASQIVGYRQSVGCLVQQLTVPQITSVNPVQVKTYRPALVTLGGNGFLGTTVLTVGGTPVTTGIQVLSDTQLRFTPPTGLPIGEQGLTATNPAGTSNSSALLYIAANPCEVYAPPAIIGGNTMAWQMGGVQNDFGFLVVSLVGTTSLFQGLPLLDGSSVLWAGGLDARGMATFTIPVPAGILNGIRVYSQLVDVVNATVNLRSVSTVTSTLVVF